MIETAERILNNFDGVSPAHGRFYLLQSRLFKATNETADYYKSALKFLGCTKLSDLSIAEQKVHAKELSIAALTAEGIYNFGELVSAHI
jgi:26S proteasome regulatory subunit N9